ncbi:hypothetical protein K443DRAFT_418597 [Laccaria amethystina LaAM-08-1]|uniref:Uncharacterized protein n=1 Tax=Laccaria amethystina LaAM-08-1 TaxID=1095629 RepID=A0A0C9WVW9_9AGAR|nr:hypothetical protein K443DRAFT_418597 [Laccaria amethystina LaAM-08-1]
MPFNLRGDSVKIEQADDCRLCSSGAWCSSRTILPLGRSADDVCRFGWRSSVPLCQNRQVLPFGVGASYLFPMFGQQLRGLEKRARSIAESVFWGLSVGALVCPDWLQLKAFKRLWARNF